MDLPPTPPAFYSQHPFLNPDFAVSWQDLQAQNLEADLLLALERAQARIDQISQQALSAVTFESTFLALESNTQELDEAWAKASHLSHVADSPAYREAYRQILPRVSDFYTKIPLNTHLFAVLEKAASLPSPLSSLQQRLKEETLYLFTSQGAHLSPEAKDRLTTLNADLARACQEFSENVLDATNTWELIIKDQEALKGLPALQLKLAEQDALAHGHSLPAYRITLHAPSYGPVLQYVESETIRKTVWEALSQVGRVAPHDNTQLITRILALRQEKAQLLGKKDFADLTLEHRMAESGTRAIQFIEELHAKTLPSFQAQIAQVAPAGKTIEPWSLAYEVEKLQQKTLQFDSETLRPYFPLPQVVEGLFHLAKALFGLKIEKLATVAPGASPLPPLDNNDIFPVWAPEVEAYKVTSEDGRHLGSFYMDLYPRPSKRSGAWANCLIPKRPIPPATLASESAKERSQPLSLSPALGLICANFTPSADGNTPPLLSHEEVQTLYHEFGHLLHIILSEVPLPSLGGIHVWWDFVELPSQILENWTWDQQSLKQFARHHHSGQSLPDELFEKLQASRTFLSALGMMRQLALSRLDLALHTQSYDEATRENQLQGLLASYTPRCYSAPPPTLAQRFTHIFSDPTGYAAGYYSYKWAEVLEADAFTRFQKEGIFNRQTGQAFQDSILSRGNSLPPKKLFKAFIGHEEPDTTPLLERYQLIPAPSK